MAEFIVSGVNYVAGTVPAMTQFHVLRRLAPVLDSLRSAFENVRPHDVMDADGELNVGVVAGLLGSMVTSISRLTDEDSTYVVRECLAVVQRQATGGTGWVQLWPRGAPSSMFENELTLMAMLEITAHVAMSFLAPFFKDLLSRFGEWKQVLGSMQSGSQTELTG